MQHAYIKVIFHFFKFLTSVNEGQKLCPMLRGQSRSLTIKITPDLENMVQIRGDPLQYVWKYTFMLFSGTRNLKDWH